jgi:dolichol-phosphate mannosyltransferase
MTGFGLIGASGFLPNLLGLYVLTGLGLHYVPAEILANQLGVAWNFLLVEQLLFRDRRRHRRWWDRAGRFALLANADLVLRIPLIALFVDRLGMGALSATALALVVTFVLRFAGTEALVYLPRRNRSNRRDRTARTARRAA